MRLPVTMLAILALLVAAAVGRAGEEPASLALARRTVDACRGAEHKKKMRVKWPAVADEKPPEGAEVVLVRGYISYEMTRMVLRGGKVVAGSVTAARSWFYNQKEGESFAASSFDVDYERFVRAWNAMRRILAASDERIEPEPKDHPSGGGFMSISHESVDWIRARATADAPPVHCADHALMSYDWDDVRRWGGVRDEAVFEVFEALLPEDAASRRAAPVAAWSDFAAAEARAVAKAPDREALDRDHEFLETCLRVLGAGGAASTEEDVAALEASLADVLDKTKQERSGFGDAGYWVRDIREEASRAATRLRIRHHWDRKEVIRTLRAAPEGTWAREDQAKWLRRTFREKDPAGWAAFLLEEATREGARPDDVAAAAAEMKDLPAADAVPVLRRLLGRDDPYVRLEAALTLHALDPKDDAAKAAVVKLALDRSIRCEWRADLTNRWSRNRALDAALDWGGLAAKDLRAHVVASKPDDPEFLETACDRLAQTPAALTDVEVRDAWRVLLDSATPTRVLAAVRFLAGRKDAASKARMLAALDRLDARIADVGEEAVHLRADVVARWRERVQKLPDGVK